MTVNKKKIAIGVAASAALLFLTLNGKQVDPNNFDVPPITVSGQKITFTCADDNTNENLLIKMDKCEFRSFQQETGYFSVTNLSPVGQDTQIQILDDKGVRMDFYELKGDNWKRINKQTTQNLKARDRKTQKDFTPRDQIEYWIPAGQTRYFRTDMTLPHNSQGKFNITAYGDNAWGTLDPSWYSNSWGYRIPITISHNFIASSTTESYANFPILATTTNASLKSTGNGGHMGKSDGTDMVFTLSDGVTKLNHEIEKYASTTGEVLAWVNVGASGLSTSTDTTLYIYYGNAAATDQQNVTGTWNSAYKGVWHLADNAATTNVVDSTGVINGTNVANTNTKTATGQIDGALTYNGTSDKTTTASTGVPSGAGARTMSVWFKTSSATNDGITGIGSTTNANQTWDLFILGGGGQIGNVAVVNFGTGVIGSTGSLNNGAWHYAVGTYDGVNNSLYIDGASDATPVAATEATNATGVTIGNQTWNGDNWFHGTLDDERISNVARSADWVKTEYNNVVRLAFETWGAEEAAPTAVTGTKVIIID